MKVQKLNLTDIHGMKLKLGDTIRIIKITDDSGSASTLFGVEPHLDGWVSCVYPETFEGVITYDQLKMMVVIKGKYNEIPLSPFVRYEIWNDKFDQCDDDVMEEIQKELNINVGYGNLIDYIKKIK